MPPSWTRAAKRSPSPSPSSAASSDCAWRPASWCRRREETITARVQGRFDPGLREILVMSRAVTQMRLTVPPAWVPAAMNWNGTDLGKAETPGCWLLDENNALLSARKCE